MNLKFDTNQRLREKSLKHLIEAYNQHILERTPSMTYIIYSTIHSIRSRDQISKAR